MVMNDREGERKYPVTGYPSQNALLSLPLGSGLDRRESGAPLTVPLHPCPGSFSSHVPFGRAQRSPLTLFKQGKSLT